MRNSLSSLCIFAGLVFACLVAPTQGLLGVQNVPFGFIPQDGQSDSPMSQINCLLASKGRSKSATYGWYAQTYQGKVWDGKQLLDVKDDVVKSGAIFEPAVMPVNSWWGYTSSNNQQAVAIAKVLKQFTDAGVEVRLRFAHEMNYYTSQKAIDNNDVRYAGGSSAIEDFKEAWSQVHSACQKYAPSVKMVWSPNNAELSEIEQWAPKSGTYDFVAMDYYPWSTATSTQSAFLNMVKGFHDKYTNGKVKFIIAETSLAMDASMTQKLQWLQTITSSAVQSALPNYISVTWFNVLKNHDFRIIQPSSASYSASFLKMAGGSAVSSTNSTSASTKTSTKASSATGTQSSSSASGQSDESESSGSGDDQSLASSESGSSDGDSDPSASSASSDDSSDEGSKSSSSSGSSTKSKSKKHKGTCKRSTKPSEALRSRAHRRKRRLHGDHH